jgi:hypothetical protein
MRKGVRTKAKSKERIVADWMHTKRIIYRRELLDYGKEDLGDHSSPADSV